MKYRSSLTSDLLVFGERLIFFYATFRSVILDLGSYATTHGEENYDH